MRYAVFIGVTGILAGCAAPSVPRMSGLQGQVEFDARSVASTAGDLSLGAAVSLIDAQDGRTVAAGITAAQGRFTLYLPASFTPVVDRLYWLDAAKGLAVGGTPNRAGTSLARLRTMLFYRNGDWASLNDTADGTTRLGWDTTTVCAIASLRGLGTDDRHGLLGHLGAGTFAAVGTVVSVDEFTAVAALVRGALRAEQDPMAAIGYDPLTHAYSRRAAGMSLDAMAQATASAASTFDWPGVNLPDPSSGAQVTLGKLTCNWVRSADGQRLVVSLPVGAYSGYLSFSMGAARFDGPFIRVAGSIGTYAGLAGVGFADGPAATCRFNGPKGLAIALDGSVVIADSGNNAIRCISPSGWVSTLAGGSQAGFADGSASAAKFCHPSAVACAPDGSVWVADTDNNAVRRIASSGTVSTLSLPPLSQPSGVVIDQNGVGYVADTGHNSILRVGFNGTNVTYSSLPLDPSVHPAGLALDGQGNLLVCDSLHNTLWSVASNYTLTSLVSGLWGPVSVGVDPQGRVLLVQCNPGFLTRYDHALVPQLLISMPGNNKPVDGPFSQAVLNNVGGMAIDAKGAIWLSESNDHQVRLADPGL